MAGRIVGEAAGPILAGPSEETFLQALRAGADPLAAVLDLLRATLGAGYVACIAVPPIPGRPAALRTSGGNGVAVEDLLRREPALSCIRRGCFAMAGLDWPGGEWAVAWPVPAPAGENGSACSEVVLAGGSSPGSADVRSAIPALSARFSSWIAIARRLGAARTPVRPAPDGETDSSGKERILPEGGIIAVSSALRDVLRTVTLVAPTEAAVLIEGESGTGKELVARAIHARSRRSGGPFVPENCAACPEGLLESEFFGVERGAYTGAHRTRAGLLERAAGGTLFLDEIGEMHPALQRKLLRALQEREVRRVGGGRSVALDFRLVSATNRILADEVQAERFRQDLLYRIDVVTIRLPPLRERREDIPVLARHFLDRHARRAGRPPPAMDVLAIRLLLDYPWPGNVRELENEMCRAVALGVEALTAATLSPKIVRDRAGDAPEPLLPPGASFGEMERDVIGGVIREALRRTSGNKNQAAQLLRIPKTTFYRRLRRYAIVESPISPQRSQRFTEDKRGE